ncbi:tryptophan--tRNA ligase [Candidatus Woesearchaeota archaeon]|nr:tryptophan--tRNA ligase [Candidatus Woesearchaeota archaeon]
MEQTVTPYKVEGEIDYEYLIKEFGLSKLTPKELERIKKVTKELHPYLRRGIFFAHRDLNWCLDEYEKGNKFFLYTGCGPSGPIHLGTHFLIDTKHAGIMYPEAIKVAKKITFSTIKAAFGFNDSNNIGSIFYTSMQTVPVFLPNILNKTHRPCLIPLGVDQDTHFRISRDVVEKLGYHKPAIIHAKFMPPLTGVEGKMSSTAAQTAIITTDDPKAVKDKINKYAFSGGQATVEEHRKKGGNPEIDVSYQWLKYFEEDDHKLQKIYNDYKSGKLLSGELKAILIEKLNAFLKGHQERRKQAPKLLNKFVYKS